MLIPDLERDNRNVLTGLGLGLDVIGDVSDGSRSVVFFDGATVFEEVERGISVDLVTSAKRLVFDAVHFRDLDRFVLVKGRSNESVGGR